MASRLQFHDTPQAFLAVAGDALAAEPVLSTVVATATERLARGPLDPVAFDRWWLTVHDGDEVVGVAMSTAPFEPHPLYLLAMPDDAARLLAHALRERGRTRVAVNGVLPAARVLAQETARLVGGRAEVAKDTALLEVSAADLVPPDRPAPGRLVRATRDHLALATAWFTDFHGAAARQAGRTPTAVEAEPVDEADLLVRIDEGVVGLWVVDDEPVHLTAWNPPAQGVARIGPVYTPAEHRGRGFAAAAVAEVSRAVLDDGHRCCLFTDQANPASNRVYEGLGYRRVAELAELVVRPSSESSASAGVTTPGPA